MIKGRLLAENLLRKGLIFAIFMSSTSLNVISQIVPAQSKNNIKNTGTELTMKAQKGTPL